eukprot:IDg2922t1
MRKRKRKLGDEDNFAELANKFLDKPNIHRLKELSKTTLPMMGHLKWIGELGLE